MRLKYVICFLFMFLVLYGFVEECYCEEMDNTEGEIVIEDMVEAIQEKNWIDFTNLMCQSEQEVYCNYFANSNYNNGVKQIENVVMTDLIQVDLEDIQSELLEAEYPILESSPEKYAYIIGLDCEVNKETKYIFKGVNYFLVVLVRENGNLKIVQFNRPSMEAIKETMLSQITFEDELYEEKLSGINVIEEAENGRIINSEGKEINNGFETINAYVIPLEEDEISIAASGTSDFPNLGEYTNYSYPLTISVNLNKTGNGEIVEVDFNAYIKNTLPNEWYASWNTESLKAGAYCVKMAGWYKTIRPTNNIVGYDVSQGTQYYKPNSAVSVTDNVVDSISGSGIANSDKQIFFPEYAEGVRGEPGTMGGGQLKQRGSQFLAEEWGYTYVGILNYYYRNSNYSSSYIKYFTY